MFFRGLKNGQALVDNDYVAVQWEYDRFIVYEYGDMRLRDDHFSKQYSRSLTEKEIKDIYWILKRVYNIDKSDTMPIAFMDTENLDIDY